MAPRTRSTQDSAQETVQETTQEVVKARALDAITPELFNQSTFDDDVLRGLSSFEQAIELYQATSGEAPTDVSRVLGDGFALLNNKGILEGVPCLFMEWRFTKGDFGTFVTARVVTRNPDGGSSKYIINDGSTGIAEQLAQYTNTTDRMGGLFAMHGLRKSDYDYTDEATGETKAATTYYIDTSV